MESPVSGVRLGVKTYGARIRGADIVHSTPTVHDIPLPISRRRRRLSPDRQRFSQSDSSQKRQDHSYQYSQRPRGSGSHSINNYHSIPCHLKAGEFYHPDSSSGAADCGTDRRLSAAMGDDRLGGRWIRGSGRRRKSDFDSRGLERVA